ncbi:vacuolar protein sorting-associated protein 51 homolog [Artemia franciscana]|uniref:Vacuolar protein sorting-associated protein 51 homolog n=1 Tax=Artemia franciscana TaxID=6661 RepID=A0AA88HIG7_ARTSF|nr:hypothetical protein QYM36_016345 [Artemia franciscana]KAK2706276.1 hypothetical protein QYM36_016345 [Artemia franciscana]
MADRSIKMKSSVEQCSSSESEQNSLDIDSKHFQPQSYVENLTKGFSLKQLMETESMLGKDITSLDSEMQTLVYENYNKFILATETIKQMTSDFKQMETGMSNLMARMENLSSFSLEINSRLQPKRESVARISETHSLLKKLQHLYDLPTKLKTALTKKNLSQAVELYLRSRIVLEQYREMPAFQGIDSDCMATLGELKEEIRKNFDMEDATIEVISESASLLLKLNENPDELRLLFLQSGGKCLSIEIAELSKEVEVWQKSNENDTNVLDLLAFIDLGSNTVITNLGLIVTSYKNLFKECCSPSESEKTLINFTMALVKNYFDVLEKRYGLDCPKAGKREENVSVLVRSLDKLYNKLQTLGQTLPDVDFGRASTDLISKVARSLCDRLLEDLKMSFESSLNLLREAIATSSLQGEDGTTSPTYIPSLVSQILNAVNQDVKNVLSTLEPFLDQSITFINMPYFYIPFCLQDVHEGTIVKYLSHISGRCEEFLDNNESDAKNASVDLLLVLSRMCFDASSSTVQHLLNYTTEQFRVRPSGTNVTPTATITATFRKASLNLLNQYVASEGDNMITLMEKSIENRNWMDYPEPRSARPAVKRIVEVIGKIDAKVGSVFEDGSRNDRGSDSSRLSYFGSVARQTRGLSQTSASSHVDRSLMSNIQKLFSEKVDLTAPVDFTKVSVVTAIVKNLLKAMLESVRVITIDRHGLHQFQVDCHFLHSYLWRFVNDESLVSTMLDDVMHSALNRCIDPSILSPSAVESISERIA